MGSGFSKGNSVWLQTDKPLYQDGDVVMGLVLLNVVKPVTITRIDCQLLGHEKTYWTETRESGTGSRRHTYTEHHGGTVQLLNVTHPLTLTQNELQPGQYQWQVVFGLPEGLPSSFKMGTGTDGAEVTYLVNLTFHTPGMFTSAIRSSQQLTVHQRLTVPAQTVDQSVEKALTSCCCFSQGTIKAHVRLDRDKVQPGEEVSVIVEVDNRSKQAVKKMALCLKHEVVARERMGGYHCRRWHREHCKADQPGVQPFTTLQGGLARRMALRLPSPLPPSMHGTLITSDYFVKVTLKFSGCVRSLKMKVPVIVAAPQPVHTEEEPFYTEAPAFWSPAVVYDNVEAIDVPSAPPLPQELLKPDAPFWTRAKSNASSDSLKEPLLGNGDKYPVV